MLTKAYLWRAEDNLRDSDLSYVWLLEMDECLPSVCEALGSFALLHYIKLGVMVHLCNLRRLGSSGPFLLHISLRPGWAQ